MMRKKCNQLIRQKHMHMKQAKIKYVRKKSLNVIYNNIKMFNFD